jgi:hypothetical protein
MESMKIISAADEVLKKLDQMTDDELMAALSECSDGPISSAFLDEQEVYSHLVESVRSDYVSNRRDVLSCWAAMKVTHGKTTQSVCEFAENLSLNASNDESYLIAA